MPKFRVFATYETALYADIEAASADDALAIAENMDGGDFKEYQLGQWQIEPEAIELKKGEENERIY